MRSENEIRSMLNELLGMQKYQCYDTQEMVQFIKCLKWVLGERERLVKEQPETEVYYTGGGIYCAVARLEDGTWFGGETNGWGCVYKTAGAAIDAYDDGDDFIRYIQNADEQIAIWKRIYAYVIGHNHYEADLCRKLLNTLEEDVRSW